MKTVGERHWTAGPIVLGSQKLHAAVCKSFTKKQAAPLVKVVKRVNELAAKGRIDELEPVAILKFEGETVMTLLAEETGCVKWRGAIVLVHAQETKGHLLERDRVAAMAKIDPKTIPADAWRSVGTLKLPKDPVLFDIHSQHVEAREKTTSIKLPLPAGDYVVELARGTADAKPYPSKIVPMAYTFVRLRPPSWVQPGTKAAKPVIDEGPVVAPAEVIAGAKKLPRASGDQIPMVVIPKQHMAAWKGLGTGEDDSDDYDRACAVHGVGAIKVGNGKGLVISEPAGMMFWPTKTGGLIVMWLGADSQAGCVAAALSIPDKAYKRETAKFVVEKGAEEIVIFDSASPGDSMTKAGKIGPEGESTATFKLAAGTYAIESMWSWEAEVKVGKKIEDTMIGVLRLTRT